jgi:hypothetical protein
MDDLTGGPSEHVFTTTPNISFWNALMASFPFVILGALSFGAAKGINFGLTYWLPDYL